MKSCPVYGQRCHNVHCGKLLEPSDFRPVWGPGTPPVNFGEFHLCSECWDKFDGQKMRGRFRAVGLSHKDLIQVSTAIEQDRGESLFAVGHPSDEQRYTESIDEWISWQGEGKSGA